MHVCADRRTIITSLMGVAVAPSVAAAPLDAPSSEDLNYMRIAIDEERRGDKPFGAVIVSGPTELVRAYNIGLKTDDPTAHAEMTAIRQCLSAHGSAKLRGSTLYASGEPCAMCMGAILWCGVGRLVFAASVAQLSAKLGQIMISSADIAARAPFTHISISGGVLAEESIALFG